MNNNHKQMRDYFYRIGMSESRKMINYDDLIFNSPPPGFESIAIIEKEYGNLIFRTPQGNLLKAIPHQNDLTLSGIFNNTYQVIGGEVIYNQTLKSYEFFHKKRKVYLMKYRQKFDPLTDFRFKIYFDEEEYEIDLNDDKAEIYFDINRPKNTNNNQYGNEIIIMSNNRIRPSLYMIHSTKDKYLLTYTSPWTGITAFAICATHILLNH
ncbi:hypothetical protein TUBRATIS_11160 [Tubulinosema ratisbonensis]|uniref:Uncharacterized protein n=1 Tax=Tubulinosema ratisbonensis TaxID=291195 RepID=A0A437AN15_9MICR|nr:hypothetical protein TUBRATIS_11160 [Tubulinosema ratisbonensis]